MDAIGIIPFVWIVIGIFILIAGTFVVSHGINLAWPPVKAVSSESEHALKKKYPLGYFMFANDKITNCIPMGLNGKEDFSFDLERHPLPHTTDFFIVVALKDFHYYPTNVHVNNLDVILERKNGTVADGIFFNNLGLFVELINATTDNISFVVGFKKAKPFLKIKYLKPDTANFVEICIRDNIISKAVTSAMNINPASNIINLVISSGWTMVEK